MYVSMIRIVDILIKKQPFSRNTTNALIFFKNILIERIISILSIDSYKSSVFMKARRESPIFRVLKNASKRQFWSTLLTPVFYQPVGCQALLRQHIYEHGYIEYLYSLYLLCALLILNENFAFTQGKRFFLK